MRFYSIFFRVFRGGSGRKEDYSAGMTLGTLKLQEPPRDRFSTIFSLERIVSREIPRYIHT